jgi:hypothetical protein
LTNCPSRLAPGNPDYHFRLGAQYDAQAATEAYAGYRFDPKTRTGRPTSPTLSKTARANYQPALEQYARAHKLAPSHPGYREAYTRLERQLRNP